MRSREDDWCAAGCIPKSQCPLEFQESAWYGKAMCATEFKKKRSCPVFLRTARIFAAVLVFAVALLAANLFPGAAKAQEGSITWSQGQEGETRSLLEEFEPYIFDAKTDKDATPSLERPRYIPATDAGMAMDSKEAVFVLEPGSPSEKARIYPQKILVYHEVINETTGGQKVSITYSPLTGSVVGFKGAVGRFNTSLGTTSRLLNSNRIFYDRSTNSEWPQILGKAISGPLEGKTLDTFPVLWTTWEKARARYPDAEVLSRKTGYRKHYDKDPYGSYQKKGTYYDTAGSYYPLTHTNLRLSAKEKILAVKKGDAALAIVKDAVAKERVANIDFGVTALAAFFDDSLDTVRVFDRAVEGTSLTFQYRDGEIMDLETKSVWTPQGEALEGRMRGSHLKPVTALDSMWFAWAAFYPYTEVYGAPEAAR